MESFLEVLVDQSNRVKSYCVSKVNQISGNNPCLGLKLTNYFSRGGSGTTPAYFSKLSFVDCNGKLAGVIDLRHQSSYKKALLKALSKLNKMKYRYNFELTTAKN